MNVRLDQVRSILQTIPTPEFANISIVEMGFVAEVTCLDSKVIVSINPSHLEDLAELCEDVVTRILDLEEVHEVRIIFSYNPPWSWNRASREAKKKLRSWGISVDQVDGKPVCPYCKQLGEPQNQLGTTSYRELAYCPRCRQSYEFLKYDELIG